MEIHQRFLFSSWLGKLVRPPSLGKWRTKNYKYKDNCLTGIVFQLPRWQDGGCTHKHGWGQVIFDMIIQIQIQMQKQIQTQIQKSKNLSPQVQMYNVGEGKGERCSSHLSLDQVFLVIIIIFKIILIIKDDCQIVYHKAKDLKYLTTRAGDISQKLSHFAIQTLLVEIK